MAVTQSEATGGTASGRRSAARFAMEAVGNFVLVFTFGAAITTHSWFAPLVIGAPLVAMVYSGSRVQGGHYNPALTLAMLIRRRLAMRDALAYWFVQLGAGVLAAVTVRAIIDPPQLAVTAAMTVKGSTLVAAFALELVFTCALCCVALDASTGSRHTVNDHCRWPIALGVIAGAIAIGAITNASWTLWVYLVSQLLSGIAATITFVSLADHR